MGLMALTSPTEKPTNRDFDIVLFGATGYVGKLTAQYLAHSATAESLRIALAGRDHKQLLKLKESLHHKNSSVDDWEIITANALNSEDMDALAKRTRVVISTVGPYSRFGALLIAACCRAGTDYVDLCGEALFIRQMIESHDGIARQSGARIVPSCGFDSVPSDLGVWYLSRKAQEPLREVTMVLRKLKGTLSGGTIASMVEVSKSARASKTAAKLLFDPHTLSHNPTSDNPDNQPPRRSSKHHDIVLEKFEGHWLGPFLMANFNTRIVRRSQMLSGYSYGDNFSYREAVDMGSGAIARFKAQLLLLGLGTAMTALTHPKVGPKITQFLPSPGQGASTKQLAEGYFDMEFIGMTETGKRVTATVRADGDPGYQVTAMMLSEAALSLATGEATGPAGFGTPAVTLGQPYLDRLHAHGMKFR
jgi:hypothetical protein